MRLLIVQDRPPEDSETFINAQATHLPCDVRVASGLLPVVDGKPLLKGSIGTAFRLFKNFVKGVRPTAGWEAWATTCGYLDAVRRVRPDILLGQFGNVTHRLLESAKHSKTPLVAHFHGQDAYRHDILQAVGNYEKLFEQASKLITVSNAMTQQLVSIGAPKSKIATIPYGIDCGFFRAADTATPTGKFVAVGRFVEKKAPHLTLFAFHQVLKRHPDARLTMLGSGPLLGACQDLVEYLGISGNVSFLGESSPETILSEMKAASCFVQHSVQASDGDSEGTPLAILEAQACSLPVVSTLHAGIQDAVLHDKTGWLVEEGDWQSMADHMIQILDKPALAREMGRNARQHIEAHYNLPHQVAKLHAALESVLC